MTDEVLMVQGIIADSKNEYNVALALDSLDVSYEFQYIVGIAGVRGAQYIDFLVYTVPKPTPLFVHGEYWHTGKKAVEDDLKMAELTAVMHNLWADPVIIWGEDSDTFDDARAKLRELLMI
jgi:hypothetical protein